MGVVVLRGNCPTNTGSCPIGVIVLRDGCPNGVVVLIGNWQRGSCLSGVILLWGSCPQGSCHTGSCSRGSCPKTTRWMWGSEEREYWDLGVFLLHYFPLVKIAYQLYMYYNCNNMNIFG